MTPITIRNCRVLVIRRDGWGWGASHRSLADRAVQLVTELLATRFAEVVPANQDVEVTSTVRLEVPLTTAELLADLGQNRNPMKHSSTSAARELVGRMDEAIRTMVLPVVEDSATQAAQVDRLADPPTAHGRSELSIEHPLLLVLLRWVDQGVLLLNLRRIPRLVIDNWHEKLLRTESLPTSWESRLNLPAAKADDAADNESSRQPFPIAKLAQSLAHEIQADSKHVKLTRIWAATRIARTLQLAPGDASVQAQLDRYWPCIDDITEEMPTVERQSLDSPVLRDDTADKLHGKKAAASRSGRQAQSGFTNELGTRRDVEAKSALPFLLLGPLSDIGYFEALEAALHAVDLPQSFQGFASALAYKVLQTPFRGWRRSPESINSAAAFAGVIDPIDNAELAKVSAKAEQFVSVLNLVLAQAVMSGHDAAQPLLLCPVGQTNRLLLIDVAGLFPVQCTDDLRRLTETCADSESVILLDSSTARPNLLTSLHKRNCRFLVDAAPVRGEPWRMVRLRGQTWSTNDATASTSTLMGHGRRLTPATSMASSFCQSLFVERRATPNTTTTDLDDALSLAAGVALAQIAWTLWHDREATTPVLALERFADLGAKVQFREEQVRVVLPLGRRSMDLEEHGLLHDVPNVPWLGHRTVAFARG